MAARPQYNSVRIRRAHDGCAHGRTANYTGAVRTGAVASTARRFADRKPGGFIMNARSLTLAAAWLAFLPTQSANAQAARTEIHAVPTFTLSDKQFLTGDRNGTPVTIGGVLRLPPSGTDRLPTVILLHGSGGIGGN